MVYNIPALLLLPGDVSQRHKLAEADYRGDAYKDWHKDVKGNNDLLCLTQPDIIRDIHAQYLRAGADIIETNTFNANAVAQADYGMQELAYQMNKVCASLGLPCVRSLPPTPFPCTYTAPAIAALPYSVLLS